MPYNKTLEEGLKEFDENPRIQVIQEIIRCKKHGNSKERYIELWEELWNDDAYELESFLTTFAEKIRGSVVGETLEIVEKERETWARESIGERAVVSVCTAIEQLKDK